MPIRNQDDGLSRVKWQESEYFKVRDFTQNHLSFNRFLYMPKGTKAGSYDWRLNFNKINFPGTVFVINQQKYVNRPDAIAYAVYGNAKFWWIIAMANNLSDPFIDYKFGKSLKIPDLDLVKRSLGM